MKHYLPENLFLVTLISFHSISVADRLCGEQSVLHESKEITRCCIPIRVEKGYQSVICGIEGEKASSEPCSPNTYQSYELDSSELHFCERHSTCPSPNMITMRNGTQTSNTICQCNEGDGYINTLPGNTVPTAPYHCLQRETVSHPSSVHNVTSEYPASTISSVPTSVRISVSVISVIIFLVTIFTVVVICCRRANCICNGRRNESEELSGDVPFTVNGVPSIGPNTRLVNGQISDRGNAADTDARLSICSNQASHSQAVDDIDSDSRLNLSLHSEHDPSDSNNFASLCQLKEP